MHSLNYSYYDTVENYESNTLSTVSSKTTIDITKLEIIKHAVKIGIFNGKTPSAVAIHFYSSMAHMGLDFTDNNIKMSESYRDSEPSIKTSLSFFMGMISTEIVAGKVYGVKQLFHLKDKALTVQHGGCIPDFYGLDRNNRPMLFEAKGTSGTRPWNKTVDHAKKQLTSVYRVNDGIKERTSFARNVICCGFDKDTSEAHIYDVDPKRENDDVDGNNKREQEGKLIFDMDDLTYQYYKKYEDAFNSNAYESKVLQFGGKSYKGIVLENVFIGMDQEINEVFAFDALKGDNKYFYYAITERLVSEQKYKYLSKEFGDNKFLDRDGIFVEYL